MKQPLLWLNLFGSLCAVVANTWTALRGQPEHRVLRWSIATIAAMFAGLYIGDLTGLLATGTRGDLAAGVAPVAWLVAWTAPAVRAETVHRRTRRVIDSMIDRLGQPCLVPEDPGVPHGIR